MRTIEREYPYGMSSWLTVTAFFLAAAGIFAAPYFALNETRGMTVQGYRLTLEQTRIFWWLGTGVFVFMATTCGWDIYRQLTSRPRLAFTPTALLVPKSRWSAEELAIEYHTIRELFQEPAVNDQRQLTVTHAAGTYQIYTFMLPGGHFDEVCGLLADRVAAARESGQPALSRS